MKKSCHACTDHATQDNHLLCDCTDNPQQLSRSYISRSQEDLLGTSSVRRRTASANSKPRPRSTLGIPKGSDYYDDFPELTVTKENHSGSQTNIARSRGGFYGGNLRGSCSYDNIISETRERSISSSPSESQINYRGYCSHERLVRFSSDDSRDLGVKSSIMSNSVSSTDGWTEIQTLLQQTQHENNDMRQRVEQLKQENLALKERLHELGDSLELKTDSEKALLLNLDGMKGKSATSSAEMSPQEEASAEVLSPVQSPDGADRTATCASDDDMVFVPEERALLLSDSNWEVQSIRSEGSVVCLQDRIHQMEETHHSVNEELQATLQELADLQEAVNDLNYENDRLVEEKSILLEALCSQTEKLQKSNTEVSHLKEVAEENDVSYDAEAFENSYTTDRSQVEQQILELMNSQDTGLKEMIGETADGKDSEDMIVAKKKKVPTATLR